VAETGIGLMAEIGSLYYTAHIRFHIVRKGNPRESLGDFGRVLGVNILCNAIAYFFFRLF
jgi:hypothetical protein